MYRNFFRISLRYLWRNRTYSLLNFLCLAFGLTCAIIALLHIQNAFNYDRFHKNYKRLYEVDAYVTYFNGARFPKDYLSASLSDVLKVQVPEIETMTRVVSQEHQFVDGDKSFTEHGIYADDNFFDAFTFPLLRGNPRSVFAEANSILITERMAGKFFENQDCIGKTLVLKGENRQEVYKITGILKNVPNQSLLQFEFVISFSKFLADNPWAMETGSSACQTWVMLKQNVETKLVENKLKNLIKNQESTLNQELFLFPLPEKILYSYASGKRVWREMQNVVIVGSIGLAILLIACFNFVNMAIALNIRRFREAGIKKVVGSKRSAIIVQFLGETYLLTLASLVSAIILVELLLAGFNTFFGMDIQLRFSEWYVLLFFVVVTIFTGLVAGLFPALYLASSNPVNVLKGRVITRNSYSLFRQGLIIFQFIIPIVLIICMLVIKIQDGYMRNFDLGIDKDKLIVLDNSKNIRSHAESVKAELLAIPGVEAVSYTNCIPTRNARVLNDVEWDGKDPAEKLHFWCINTDFDYNKTVEVKMTAGRFFQRAYSTDSVNYLINDVAATVMKYKNPVGSQLTLEGKKGTIIGTFSDFHALDLAGPYVPTVIRIKPGETPTILIKFSSGTYSEVTEKIGKIYKNYEPEALFQPRLLRDITEISELSLPSNLVGLASVLAILLACLGLYGLASFTAESRTKEIGIRKVNGATIHSIVILLLRNYTKWVTIAFILSLPIAYFLGNMFLGRFFFHTSMPFWPFVAGPIIAYLIALSTVLWQSLRAASRNPVAALRYE
jgi:ABC-type antimicrobial peptide transport system permease subunit